MPYLPVGAGLLQKRFPEEGDAPTPSTLLRCTNRSHRRFDAARSTFSRQWSSPGNRPTQMDDSVTVLNRSIDAVLVAQVTNHKVDRKPGDPGSRSRGMHKNSWLPMPSQYNDLAQPGPYKPSGPRDQHFFHNNEPPANQLPDCNTTDCSAGSAARSRGIVPSTQGSSKAMAIW